MKIGSIGSGFVTINISVIKIPNSEGIEGYSYRIPPGLQEKIDNKKEYIKMHRGEVISRCVDIDHLLGESISQFFLKDNAEKREIFHKLILDAPDFSISKKRNIFKSIMKNHPDEFKTFSPKEQQKFFKELDYVIRMRNALAHGDVIYDYNADKVFLQYCHSQQKKEVVLDQDFFDELRNKISTLVSNFLTGGFLDLVTFLT
jgi:hypothetical protein